mgnify:CR=1 FL=1
MLFRSARYEEALVVLRDLNRTYPNAKNVLFPMAMCLEQLQRGQEALPLCELLWARFQDHRALEMQLRLRPSQTDLSLETIDFHRNYALPDLGSFQTIAVPSQEEEKIPPWKIAVISIAGLVAVLLLLFLPFLLQGSGVEPGAEVSDGPTTDPAWTLMEAGFFLIGLVLFQWMGTAVASIALGTVKKLPENTISGVLFHVGMTLFAANCISAILTLLLVACAPLYLLATSFVVEHVVMLIVFSYTYRFSIGDSIVFFGFFFIFMCVTAFVLTLFLGTGAGFVALLFAVALG